MVNGVTIVCLMLVLFNTMSMEIPFIFKALHVLLVLGAWFVSGLIMGPILILIGIVNKVWMLSIIGAMLFMFKR